MIYLGVTNFSLILGTLISFLIFSLLIYAIFRAITDYRLGRSGFPISAIFMGIFSFFVFGLVFTECNLLFNYIYVEGRTITYCKSGKNGIGIEFEYFIDGKKYIQCSSSTNLKIKVPDGLFKVRVSKINPSIGRIDFDKPLTAESQNSMVE